MTDIKTTFSALFESSQNTLNEFTEFYNTHQSKEELIIRGVVQGLLDRGYNLGFVMTRPVAMLDDRIIEAKTRKLRTRLSPNSDMDTVIQQTIAEFAAEIDSLPSTSRFCPYHMISSTGVVIDPTTFEPVISFMTRYGILENAAATYSTFLNVVNVNGTDIIDVLVNNYAEQQVKIPELTADTQISNQNSLTAYKDKLLEHFLEKYATELELNADSVWSKSHLAQHNISTQHAPMLVCPMEHLQDMSAYAAESEVMDVLASSMMEKFLELKNTLALHNQQLKLVQFKSNGLTIDPETFQPVIKFTLEYAAV